jgi:hypothetical protein
VAERTMGTTESLALHCTAFSKCCAMQCQTPRRANTTMCKTRLTHFPMHQQLPKLRSSGSRVPGSLRGSADDPPQSGLSLYLSAVQCREREAS